ncbi:hypothetical protein [uncultured Eudoraea sp.]|uniref:hypothetical protein n=1 Tax=uncultured Eudoraea sp. TaxID=1035614 RepID=UPI002635C871|nr:hypothetical protein [uncultured Eudoraea sp.]
MKHIFYLHGMIIEVQGINAVSDQFGPYEYNAIIDSLKATGAEVHAEVRTEETDFFEFGKKISKEIDGLISKGVAPSDITVIGASKGGMIAMYISDMNPHKINYVLLGSDSPYTRKTFDFNLHGTILGIYERSDNIAPDNYQYWIDKSTNAGKFEQLRINTGLGHGFLYTPNKAWLLPATEWPNHRDPKE